MNRRLPNLKPAFEAARCPTRETLEAFSFGELPDAEVLALADHCAGCTDCEQAVQAVWRGSLGSSSTAFESHFEEESARQRMIEAAKKAVSAGGRPADHGGAQRVEESHSTNANSDATGAGAEALHSQVAIFRRLPARVGRYEIIGVLGTGSFGTVLRGVDRELGRDVAVKMPRLQQGDKTRELFLREARAAARLRHPGIITIYDVGYAEDGAIFIAMECLDGPSLRHVLAEGRPSLDRAVEIVEQVADAIDFAHQAGLVHRDLKPGNILIGRDGHVRVADFGLALNEEQRRPPEGEFAGSPAYMSPEQVRGEVGELDGRTDVWSLGVILYGMLAGARPFEGDKDQLREAILWSEPISLRRHDDRIPRALEHICLKCLRKEARERYPTAAELAAELRGWRSANRRLANRQRRWIIASGLSAGTALLGLVVAFVFSNKAPSFPASRRSPSSVLGPSTNSGLPSLGNSPVWRSLMTPTPLELFPATDRLERWTYNAANNDLLMSNRSCGLLALGESDAEQFQLRATLSKSALAGSAGLFFGFAPVEAPDGLKRWQCQTVGLTCLPENRLMIDWHHLILQEVPGASFNVAADRGLGDFLLDDKNFLRNATLKLACRGGQVCNVYLDGERIADLRATPGLHQARSGKLGVFNSLGSTIFNNIEFTTSRSD